MTTIERIEQELRVKVLAHQLRDQGDEKDVAEQVARQIVEVGLNVRSANEVYIAPWTDADGTTHYSVDYRCTYCMTTGHRADDCPNQEVPS
jgi:hypothetical protein